MCVLGSSLQARVCKDNCTLRMIWSFLPYKSVVEIVVCFEDPGVCSLQTHTWDEGDLKWECLDVIARPGSYTAPLWSLQHSDSCLVVTLAIKCSFSSWKCYVCLNFSTCALLLAISLLGIKDLRMRSQMQRVPGYYASSIKWFKSAEHTFVYS